MADIFEIERAFNLAGFRTKFNEDAELVVRAENTDGQLVDWITFGGEDGEEIYGLNTDQLNIWFCDNPAYGLIDADTLYELFSQVADLLEHAEICIHDFVDPEDWQELDGAISSEEPRYVDIL